MTLFVGPNNGGKSTALAELFSFANRGNSSPVHGWSPGKVISQIAVSGPATLDEALEFLKPRTESIDEHRVNIRTFQLQATPPGGGSGLAAIQLNDLNPELFGSDRVAVKLLAPYTVSLNGRQRFELAGPRQSGHLDGPPTSHWMAVERDDAVYETVDRMIFGAFERHLVMQTLHPPQIEPALSRTEVTPEVRHSTTAAAVAFQSAAIPLNQMSDGVQVFCGLVAAVAALPHVLLLVDEPEAFLHPTLCRRLGADLARIARDRNAQLFSATHSADFLMGCLEEVPDTTIIRLTYSDGAATSHALLGQDVTKLARQPLLRSVSALRALFARAAIVCEADSDRAFYEEINRRLLEADDRVGAPDTLFLNAQNWQTTARIAGPLRAAGVPAAVVVDLDTVAVDDGWPDLVGICGLQPDRRNQVLAARAEARDAILGCGRVAEAAPLRVKTEGLPALDESQREIVEAGLAELSRVGIFAVPAGELERWLPQLGCTNKQTWVTEVLARLGVVGDAAYVTPGGGDVWEFLESIARWLTDAGREGMPPTPAWPNRHSH